jgi:hypothetical protein
MLGSLFISFTSLSLIRFLTVMRYFNKLIEFLFSRGRVTIDGVWIGNWIY